MIILAGMDEEAVELILPASQSALVDKLKLYAIGHRVQFAPLSPVAGLFASDDQARSVPGPEPRALKLADAVAAAAHEPVLRWQHMDMAASLAWLRPETAGRHLPQFLGLEENLGLSYRKGCYPGQEVIARVHYLGSVKHKLLGFAGTRPTPAAIAAGSGLCDAAGELVGEVLNCLLIEDRLTGLAVCKTRIEPGAILHCPDGADAETVRMVLPSGLC
ncbi:MAG: tRNA-modifying protein YgfZ [Wenzhouxiangella sp.]|nr:tRNA-modifying protein YgfZ [Wenzhouxiangella sp.]MCH8478483.1 tRNA-modifying protein YgfZ [Wenzhouxiangella sp.]